MRHKIGWCMIGIALCIGAIQMTDPYGLVNGWDVATIILAGMGVEFVTRFERRSA